MDVSKRVFITYSHAATNLLSNGNSIAKLLESTNDHPDVEELHKRVNQVDQSISLATVYRTVKLFEESGILDKLEFGDGRARYEDADRDHHDHLINIQNGEVIEFVDSDIELLQRQSRHFHHS